jgi:hypothetical protein
MFGRQQLLRYGFGQRFFLGRKINTTTSLFVDQGGNGKTEPGYIFRRPVLNSPGQFIQLGFVGCGDE